MLVIAASWLVLLVSLIILAWILFTKVRGELNYWIRPVQTDPIWAVGRTLQDGEEKENPELLPALNAFLRSQDTSSNTVIRQWDLEKKTLFLGLAARQPIAEAECVAAGYELRELEDQAELRLSGTNRISDEKPAQAVALRAKEQGLEVDLSRPTRLSGQSFSVYQWPLLSTPPPPPAWSRLAEKTLQLRDILVFPIVLTVVALGLLGTRQPILFGGGLFLIIFLSGACKFVFMYKSEDEAEEIHLQNY